MAGPDLTEASTIGVHKVLWRGRTLHALIFKAIPRPVTFVELGFVLDTATFFTGFHHKSYSLLIVPGILTNSTLFQQ